MEVDLDKILNAYSYEGETYGLLYTGIGSWVMVVFRDGAWARADVDDPALIIAEGNVISIPMLKASVSPLDSINSR